MTPAVLGLLGFAASPTEAAPDPGTLSSDYLVGRRVNRVFRCVAGAILGALPLLARWEGVI